MIARWSGCVLLLATAGCVPPPEADDVAELELRALDSLPAPVTNNAVAAASAGGSGNAGAGREDESSLASFAGLGAGKAHADVHARVFLLSAGTGGWSAAGVVPGGEGRLAAVAAGVGGRMYVFGGYTVAADGGEVSLPYVHAFDPRSGGFARRADMPVPVDDAVALVYRDRYVYLVSGWHDLGNVNLVQRYDTVDDRWDQATPYPGAPVFGHAGGIVGEALLVCGGVLVRTRADRRREFGASDACFLGEIDAGDARRIEWRRAPPMPGPPRYRAAAAGSARLDAVVFAGGSDNPYNYDGIGYDGRPSSPLGEVVLFDLGARRWRVAGRLAEPSMDHRGLIEVGEEFVLAGGMLAGQRVTDQVVAFRLPAR